MTPSVFVDAAPNVIQELEERLQNKYQVLPVDADRLKKYLLSDQQWAVVSIESPLVSSTDLPPWSGSRLFVLRHNASEVLPQHLESLARESVEAICNEISAQSAADVQMSGSIAPERDVPPVPVRLSSLIHARLMSQLYNENETGTWNRKDYNEHLQTLALTMTSPDVSSASATQWELATSVLTAKLTKFLIETRHIIRADSKPPTMPAAYDKELSICLSWPETLTRVFAFIDLVDLGADITISREDQSVKLRSNRPISARTPRPGSQIDKDWSKILQLLDDSATKIKQDDTSCELIFASVADASAQGA